MKNANPQKNHGGPSNTTMSITTHRAQTKK